LKFDYKKIAARPISAAPTDPALKATILAAPFPDVFITLVSAPAGTPVPIGGKVVVAGPLVFCTWMKFAAIGGVVIAVWARNTVKLKPMLGPSWVGKTKLEGCWKRTKT